MKFKIVIPTYNTEKWIARCLHSVKTQVYQDFECIVFNDASTDNTGQAIDNYFANFPDDRFTVVHNENNRKALANIVDGFKRLNTKDDPESVLMVIDGDDYLFCEYVLTLVAQVYENNNCLLTYGNHVHWPTGAKSNCMPFPKHVVENNSYREHKFVASHLRTFKSKLWNNINDADLRDTDGEYFRTGWDVAFMIPMLEMSGGNFLFVPNVLYVYNRINPISDDVIYNSDQGRVDRLVRTRKKYEVLR